LWKHLQTWWFLSSKKSLNIFGYELWYLILLATALKIISFYYNFPNLVYISPFIYTKCQISVDYSSISLDPHVLDALILWHVLLFAFDGSKQGVSHSSITWENLITLASRAVGRTFSLMQMLRTMFKIRDNKNVYYTLLLLLLLLLQTIFSVKCIQNIFTLLTPIHPVQKLLQTFYYQIIGF
jgi:hypothetical protein